MSLTSLDDLRRYVRETLAGYESLLPDGHMLTEQVLYRGEAPCGMHFQLHGPRAVCLSAIWETEQNSILFYGSCGRRICRTQLAAAPALT